MKNSAINKSTLLNGLTVVSEKIESVRSISVGVWVKTGSRYEIESQNGIAHFLEHMVFKGTKKRSALKIAQGLEFLGGNLNAFTSKEITCFYANSLDIHLKQTIDILSDILCNSIFPEKEIEKEKMVVNEEIKAVKDTPEEYIFDIFQEKLFPDCSLGRPILGREETIKHISRDTIIKIMENYYTPDNIIISAAGNLEHDKLIKLVEKYFHFPSEKFQNQPTPAKIAVKKDYDIHQPINQAHICIGGESIPFISEKRYPLLLLNTFLGGGMSSRLFQKLREKSGLAYSVYSFADFYLDVGIFGVYIGTDKNKLHKAEDLLLNELKYVTEKPISNGILNKLKNQLKGNIVLGLENTSRRMSRLAKNEIYFGKYISIDYLIEKIDEVTSENILEIANEIIRFDNFTKVVLRNKN